MKQNLVTSVGFNKGQRGFYVVADYGIGGDYSQK